jgi:hypothetical protein
LRWGRNKTGIHEMKTQKWEKHRINDSEMDEEDQMPERREAAEEGSRTLENTRRGVARLEVNPEEKSPKASKSIGEAVGKMVSKAKGGWSKVKSLLEGKKLVRAVGNGTLLLKEKDDTGVDMEEVMEEWEEDLMGGVVEVEEEEMMTEQESDKISEKESGRRGNGFEFLEELPVEEKDEELEEKRKEGRKRKREGEGECQDEGLLGTGGWKRREVGSRDAERWKRETGKWKEDQDGELRFVKDKEKIPLPEKYRLGLEGRGKFLNHSGKPKNNFGMNKSGLFASEKGGNEEGKNWISTFTKSGCIACRNEGGGG